MMHYIKRWYLRKFDSNEPAVFVGFIFFAVLVINFFGDLLAPILAGIVIAYLLEAVVSWVATLLKINRTLAFYLVFVLFITMVVLSIIFLLPQLIHQLGEFIQSIPLQLQTLQSHLYALSDKYPKIITHAQLEDAINAMGSIQFDKLASISQDLIKFSLNSLSSVFSWLVYVFIVPLLAFFFLKDKNRIGHWFVNMLPKERGALEEVWSDVRPQLGNYVKGKTIEFIIVSVVTYIGFIYFNLNYALLLAILVGLSVLIPYIGMVIVTIPVALIGLGQYGFSSTFFYMFLVYLIIQALDGNLLVPLLYSEALSLHPVAVIAAVLIFGGIWGFWGLFFAIPLAALINSGVKMWTRRNINNRSNGA